MSVKAKITWYLREKKKSNSWMKNALNCKVMKKY